jgi:hypothetical protein
MRRSYEGYLGLLVGFRKREEEGLVDSVENNGPAERSGGMGFKDLTLFNQALLEKQAWCLITCSDSLCARVLRAKYYLRGNLLDTVTAGEASQTWRATDYGL